MKKSNVNVEAKVNTFISSTKKKADQHTEGSVHSKRKSTVKKSNIDPISARKDRSNTPASIANKRTKIDNSF